VAKILVVLLAYSLLWFVQDAPQSSYYFACSIAYALVAIACCFCTQSRLITLYALCNLVTAIAHFLLNFGLYSILKGSIWYSALNLSLILECIELMLLLTGAASVLVFIVNFFSNYTSKHSLSSNSMAKVK